MLRIGSWQRHAKPDQRDLVVFSCDVKELLTIQVANAGLAYRMEVPYDSVVHADFTPGTTTRGTASFTLSRPPRFLQARKYASDMVWESGNDWTEEHAATVHLQHILTGAAPQLSNLVQTIRQAGQPRMHPLSRSATLAEKPLGGFGGEYEGSHLPHQYPELHSRSSQAVNYLTHRPLHSSRSVSSITFPATYSEPDLQPAHHHPSSHFGSSYPGVDYSDSSPLMDGKGMVGTYPGSSMQHALNRTAGPAGQSSTPYFTPSEYPDTSYYARSSLDVSSDFQSRTPPPPMTTSTEYYGQPSAEPASR